jgi:hypothetical protein
MDVFEYQNPTNKILEESSMRDITINKIYNLLCEFKPELGSVSSLMQKIHAYNIMIEKKYKNIIPIVITFYSNTKFDRLLETERIKKVIHINERDCT